MAYKSRSQDPRCDVRPHGTYVEWSVAGWATCIESYIDGRTECIWPAANVLRLIAVPSMAIHASSHSHGVLRFTASCTARSSSTATPVSHGCKYQHGICNAGWSPCESRGNTAALSWFDECVDARGSMWVSCTDAPDSTSVLKRLVWTRRSRLSGEPSVQ
jgi:hypothetical protein